jgi:hypothetical protein
MKLLHLGVFAFFAAVAMGGPPAALAQGSTGGSIGKKDKGVSGAFDTPSPSRKEAPARAKRSGGGGGGGNYDGTWTSVAISNNGCSGVAKATVHISGGRMSTNEGLSGTVSGNGSMRATWRGSGMTATANGRFSGRTGQGTFKRSDGCSGSWSMSKN